MLSRGLRLIDSNFPVLGLRPPRCCVYVAPFPAGSIHTLPKAQSPRRPSSTSSMSLDSEDTGTNRAATYADRDGAGRFRNSRVARSYPLSLLAPDRIAENRFRQM